VKSNSNYGNSPALLQEAVGYEPNKWWVLASVMIGTFMAVLDSTIVSVAFPKMMAVFGVSVDQIEWVMTAYLLVFAVVLPSSGWVADHFGYKKTYMLGLLLFTVGSLLCSLSWNEDVLIAFRLVQGAGAGFVMPVGMAIVTRTFPPKERGTALGFWGIAAAASVSLGPLVGGYLVDNFSWHSIFDINIPVGIAGILAVWVIQKEYKAREVTRFDVLGFFTMSIALGALLLALSTANSDWNTDGWTSTFIMSCFFIAALNFVLFVMVELKVSDPIVNIKLFKNFNFGLSAIIMFVFGIAFYGNAFLLPIFLQNSLGYTALQAGMVFFPVGILQAFISPVSGKLTDSVNPKFPALMGMSLLAGSLFLMSFFSLQTSHAQVMLPIYLRGMSLGLIFTPMTTIALLEIPRPQLAQASGLFNTVRQIGGSFGIAVLGTLLTQRITFHKEIFGGQLDATSPAFHEVVKHLREFAMASAGAAPHQAALQAKMMVVKNMMEQAFVQGINDDFFVGGLLTAALIIPLLMLKTKRLNR
jgi:DHA2 family multidrug resistance protein